MDETERFALAFEYHFKQLYAPSFPREPMLNNLIHSIDSLFKKAKRLKSAKDVSAKSDISVSLWEAGQSLNASNNHHVLTSARRQFNRMLNSCLVQNLFLAYDEISNYSEELPPLNEQDIFKPNGLPIKIVNIVKTSEPLGVTIKAYPNGEIYVARVIVGGAADRCGSIQAGDQILEVNDVGVSFKSPQEIIEIVQEGSPDGVVSFKLVPNKNSMIESTSSRQKTKMKRYVRAHFDYMGSEDWLQPCRQAALSFQNGDILEILETEDPYWNQARCIGHGTLKSNPVLDDEITITDMSSFGRHNSSKYLSVGLIPTELVLYKQKVTNLAYSCTTPDLCYEPVAMLPAGENRPIVLVGAAGVGRNELKKRLIAQNPLKFSSPVPHTSRPRRSNERQGVDYIFVSREEIEMGIANGRFIEFGEYNGNLYGTMDKSILDLLEQGRTPVINAHCMSLSKLRNSIFKPLVVFIEPPNFSLLRKTRMASGARSSFVPNGRYFNDRDFAQIISYSAQLSLTYGHLVDFRIVNGVLSDTVNELLRILHDYEKLPAWVPETWTWTNNEDPVKNSIC